MELKLEQLAYQKKAIESVTVLFEGQEKNSVSNSSFADIQTNYTHLTQEQLEKNVKKIIAGNGISLQDCKLSSSNDYCIEMETGTGKTLVYIRTVYELAKAYNFTKFIILVPSVAIKEGFSPLYKRLASSYFIYITSA
jgi:type III restriction enzyme